MSKNWYSIKAAAEGKSAAEVYIFDYIGYWDISARNFIDELKAIDADQIDLHINSPGGSVFDGVAIQNSIKHHKANVTVYIDGIAGSIASIIALSGDQIYIAENAYVIPLLQYVQPVVHREGLKFTPHVANFILPQLVEQQ